MASNGAKRDEKGRNIQVVVRCRPFNTVERKTSHGVIDCDQSRREVTVRTGGPNDKAARKTYTFDMVFAPAAKQIEVYRSVVCPILDEVIMGYNCTVFAYGQTGTGKTFTMEGERTPDEQFTWEEDPLAGIIPRTLHQIFEKLSDNGTEFSVKVSLLEIYNEELFDLLSPVDDVNERLQLFDDPRNKRGVVVKGLEEITVHNKDEVYQILERGSAKRKTASTLMNAYSSRSHSVFSVTIHMKEITLDGEELVKIGKLNLVDLAGSENIGRSGAVDKRAREAGNINQSLLTLGRVITALVEKRPHIPYRESKLTRILQDSLGGRTKTSIIATVSPSSSNLEETLSTLEYACRAKNIMNKPEVNQKLTKRTLIKEYTEEIERLKRDLVATRDKNGVYLSAENYQNMVGQISSHEEQITEYTEKIAAMEEEIRKITELFVDSKSKLEQCTVDLEEKQQRLEETSRDLEETKEKLTQEEFICCDLAEVQESLYNTAGQLLNTVDVSTSDVSSLHDKLDRKKKVEQHNQNIQQNFGQKMEEAFNNLQDVIQNQSHKHQELLTSYSQTIDGAVEQSDSSLKASLSTVEQFVGEVSSVVCDGVKRCKDKLVQLESIGSREREVFLQLLEEHQQDMEETLVNKALLSLSAVKDLGDNLRSCLHTQRELANQVEAMKDMSVSFSQLIQDLSRLRENTEEEVQRLLEEQRRLEEEIQEIQEEHQTSLDQTVQSFTEQMKLFSDQMNLLSLKREKNFTKLRSSSRALHKPLQDIQENISSGCSSAERRVSVQAELVCSSSSSLASSFRKNTDDGLETLKELKETGEYAHSALSDLVQRDVLWVSKVRKQSETTDEEQRHLLDTTSTEAEALLQTVESLCLDRSSSTVDQLSAQSLQMKDRLQSLKERSSSQRNLLQKDQEEVQEQLEKTQGLVTNFLQEELQRDLPTGSTPQRRDFLYPRDLVKSRSRSELLEELKNQQEALKTALEEEPEEEEEEQHSRDSLEDEPSTCNESLATEPSFIDENLVFNETERLPFFKKKGKAKQSKVPPRSKTTESTPQQASRLPLRSQN